MQTRDLNYIQIKTKRSPTAKALKRITSQKLKPYYNTVYQLLNLKSKRQNSYQKFCQSINATVQKQLPQIILKRRIKQETLQFKIKKCQKQRHFQQQTECSILRKSKSVANKFHLSKGELNKHKNKDRLGQTMTMFRSLSKSFSDTLIKQKRQYNILQESKKTTDNHYKHLQLEPKFLGYVQDIYKQRYKIESNKWLQNVIVSNDQEFQSIVQKRKNQQLYKQTHQYSLYKGVNDDEIKQCQQVIIKDQQLLKLSLNHTIQSNNVSQVKNTIDLTRSRLQYLWEQHNRHRQSQNQNPQSPRTFRKNNTKKSVQKTLEQLKTHQKSKSFNRNMKAVMHRKLFLKAK